MSSNVATPVKIAPAGQPKVDTAPGPNKNTASPPKSAVNTGITTAPGPNANTAAPPKSAVDTGITTAPEGGEKGMAEQGGSTALTKSAGFAAGMAKAAATYQADDDAREEQAFLGALASEGVDPEVFMALVTLEEHGIQVPGVTEKVAEVVEKIALDRYSLFPGSTGMRAREAPKGQKLKEGAKGYIQDAGHTIAGAAGGAVVGGAGGTALGAAIGHLVGKHQGRGGSDLEAAKHVGGAIGGALGAFTGSGLGGSYAFGRSIGKTKGHIDAKKKKNEG